MKKDKNPYQFCNNYVLRTPTFSVNFYKKFTNKSSLTKNDFLELDKNLVFMEALYLASSDLYFQVKKWFSGILKESEKNDKLQYTILKYVARISTRCTPFVIFAGCNVDQLSNETNLYELKKASENVV